MTEDIVIDLSQSKDLFVVARNSTEVYRGKAADVREVGRELGVHYLLEGSIQPSEGRIKVTAQLIDARTGGGVWSTRYNRPAADLFEVQRDVTSSIAATLIGYQGTLAQSERNLIRRKPPESLTAYEHYLLGMEAKHGGSSGSVTKEGLEEAERRFRKALEIDPQLARAYVGLAYILEYRLELGLGGTPAENIAALAEIARKAVQLDPNDGEAQLVLGHLYSYQGLSEQAREQYARAEALAPSSADVLILIAWYLPPMGETRRAVDLAERALKLNPNYHAWYNQGLRYVYFYDRQFEKAARYGALVPAPAVADHAYNAAARAMTGDLDGARSSVAEVARLDPSWNAERFISEAGGLPDDVAQIYIEGAQKAGLSACASADELEKSPGIRRIKVCDAERARKVAGTAP
jgi:hypothetical protein